MSLTSACRSTIDVPEIFVSVAGPEFVHQLSAARPLILQASDDDLLALYRGTAELDQMHRAFVGEGGTELRFEYAAWFEPFVMRWLATIDSKTTEWVQRAIEGDSFAPEGEDGHSSSIVDLIASCRSATEFLEQLAWPDEEDNARYLTRLSQTIAKSIEHYSNTLEALFLREMFPTKPSKDGVDKDVARPSAWLTKAKLAVQGDKKVEPFVFEARSCVKLNNIQAARQLLDSMYTALDADRVGQLLEQRRAPVAPAPQGQRFLFTVKIVLGENLALPSQSSSRKRLDPFLILSDPKGYRVAKTRTLYETNDPRWDETVDLVVQDSGLWLRATVYSRNLVDDHEKVGYAYIHLQPNKYADFLPQDSWYRLEDAERRPLDARLLLRISMEGEQDDIRFYFGRAFRSLKRAENDMVRTMVDKMTPFVRHYLSRSTIRQLVKQGFAGFEINVPDIDFEKVRGGITNVGGKLNAMMRDLTSGDKAMMIPPVEEPGARARAEAADAASTSSSTNSPALRKKVRGPLTDLEIEDAVGPLLDYFSETFPTLKESLSSSAWDLVMHRLWKEILTTLESLILPPLSDRPTEMRPLEDKEVDIVFKWLGFLVSFFNAGGEGVGLEELRNARYQGLLEARMYYDWSEDALMEEAVRSSESFPFYVCWSSELTRDVPDSVQRQLASSSFLGRTKSVYQQRNLGTIRARKSQKKRGGGGGGGVDGKGNGDGSEGGGGSGGETILRILRMHPHASDFLRQQISTLARLQADATKQQQRQAGGGSLVRRGGAGRQGRRVPDVPSVPETY